MPVFMEMENVSEFYSNFNKYERTNNLIISLADSLELS